MPRDEEPRPSVLRRALSRILALNRAEPSVRQGDDGSPPAAASKRDDESEVPVEPDASSVGQSDLLEPHEVLPASSARPPIPERFGRYVILGKLGEGGLSVVYSAYDPELDRRVAIKILRTGGRSPGGASHARLLREAQAIARLSHPNVIQVFDAGESEGQVFVTMELVRGQTLRAWLRHQEHDYWARSPTDRDAAGSPRLTRRTKALALPQPRPWQEVLAVFIAAGRGLAAAHAAGVIHRDFKPDNVMIDRDGRVRVLDFGLARSLRDEAPERARVGAGTSVALDADLTRTGTIMGTPAYMAPEQLDGEPSDARSDQFSYCVALYEAMYGERPFGGKTIQALMASLAQGPTPPPAEAAAPVALWPMLRRGLSHTPLDRHPSMDDLLAALESLVRARPRRWARWEPWGVMAALVTGVLGWAVVRDDASAPLCEQAPLVLEGASAEAPALHERLAAWHSAVRRACERPALEAGVVRCLERQRVELDELARATEAEARVAGVVERLPPPEACSALAGRGAPEPPPLVEPVVRARIQLALGATAEPRDATTLSRELAALESTEDDVELAETLLVIASLDGPEDEGSALGSAEDALYLLYQAVERAEAARRPDIAARAWLDLVERRMASDPAAAQELLRVGLTALARAGNPAWLMARWHEVDARLALAAGPAGRERAVQALVAQLEALEAVELRSPAHERAVVERLVALLREANRTGEAERWSERLAEASAEPP